MIQLLTTLIGGYYASQTHLLANRITKLEKDIKKMPTKADVLSAVSGLGTDLGAKLEKIESDLAAYQAASNNGTANSQDLQDILDAVADTKNRLYGAADEIDSKLPEQAGETGENTNPEQGETTNPDAAPIGDLPAPTDETQNQG